MNQLLSRHERVSIRQWRLVKVGSALCSQLCSSCVIPSTVHPSCRCFIFLSFSPRRDSLSSKSKYSRNSRNDTPSTLVKRGCTYLIPSQRLAIIFPQFLPTLIPDIHAHRQKKREGEWIATTTGCTIYEKLFQGLANQFLVLSPQDIRSTERLKAQIAPRRSDYCCWKEPS